MIAPELALTAAGVVALLAAAAHRPAAKEFRDDGQAPLRLAEWTAILGVAVSGLLALLVGLQSTGLAAGQRVHFWGGMTHDAFSAYFKVAVALSVLIVMAMLTGYRRAMFNRPELYGLLAFATLAIYFMASATELVLIFIALECLSLTSYAMVGYQKDDARSAEAGLKYFLFGAVCGAVMLYGMSLLYGLTGTTLLPAIAAALGGHLSVLQQQIAVIAALLVLAGIGFKISVAPFLQWVPEAYEGAPTPITAFLSVASKAAGFALAVRIFAVAFGAEALAAHWAVILSLLAIITMTWGNTAAIWQTNVKRMLAYSSIAQAGYIVVGLVALGIGGAAATRYAVPGILLYVLAYMFMNLGAFAVVIAVHNQTGSDRIPDYAGLAHRAPWLAALMTLFLLSLIGIPPTAGFIAKLYLFLAAIQGASPWLVALAIAMIVNSVISAYYYLNVVRLMYFGNVTETAPIATNRALTGALTLAAVATLAIFFWAQPFIDVATLTAQASDLIHGIGGYEQAGR